MTPSHKYAARRPASLSAKTRPKVPEPFLDVSYCHVDHGRQWTWLPYGASVNDKGRKPIMVIFGAFVVFAEGKRLRAEIVRRVCYCGRCLAVPEVNGCKAAVVGQWTARSGSRSLKSCELSESAGVSTTITETSMRHAEGRLR